MALPDGQCGAICYYFDSTDLRTAEAALSESEERFRLLVEQAADGIFLADAQGRYTDANTSGLEMLGYTLKELRELTVTDVIVPEEVPRMPEQMESLAGGAVLKNEWQFRRKDGSTFTGEVVGRQLPDGRLLGILRDVTARRQAEEASRRSEERLSRSQEIAHLGSWELDLVSERTDLVGRGLQDIRPRASGVRRHLRGVPRASAPRRPPEGG